MAAYLLAEARVGDAVAYETYKLLAQAAIARYGGRYLARGGRSAVLEGNWTPPQRLVIVEFDSLEQVKRFYDSPEYQAARAARQGVAEMNMLVVEGLPL
ncbi:MAG: DUF1330 domain-containing protein [Candidatus Accumulibacter sp.]|uniref:DUF1330 domain-containing protein n=1 Tax=Accumulibacter sp. TaxID=2053492 RepID=UPI001A4D8302|nr:DUF1330 domain-containing protein [Accumulibacter sp.]MBL8395244.1 DUF1330 domain-containing protein [Accumulibacter sp.]